MLVVSEELDELFEVCDRLAVMAGGRLSPVVPTRETSVEKIGVWMSGLWPGSPGSDPASVPINETKVSHVAQA